MSFDEKQISAIEEIKTAVQELNERVNTTVEVYRDEHKHIDEHLTKLESIVQQQRDFKAAYEKESAEHEKTRERQEKMAKQKTLWQLIASALISVAVFCGIIIAVT